MCDLSWLYRCEQLGSACLCLPKCEIVLLSRDIMAAILPSFYLHGNPFEKHVADRQ